MNWMLDFLDLPTGQLLGMQHTCGAVKSAPVVDSWAGKGWVWVASHGKRLLAFNSQGVKTTKVMMIMMITVVMI